MKYLIFLIPLLLIGCASTANYDTATEYLENMKMTYPAYSYYDSGFAGVDGSEYSGAGVSMDAKEVAWNLEFGEKIAVGDMDCFLHEQWGVSLAAICFEAKEMILFHYVQTEGNHRVIEQVWTSINYPNNCEYNPKCEIEALT